MSTTDSDHDSLRKAKLVEHREAEEDAQLDDAAAIKAAEALRHAELEAVDVDAAQVDEPPFESLNIDELRAVAKELGVPDRGTIVDRDELIAAIRARL